MSHRRAGKSTEKEHAKSHRAILKGLEAFSHSVDIVSDNGVTTPKRRRVVVFQGDPEEVRAKSHDLHDDLIVEKQIRYWPHLQLHRHRFVTKIYKAGPVEKVLTISVKVTGGRK